MTAHAAVMVATSMHIVVWRDDERRSDILQHIQSHVLYAPQIVLLLENQRGGLRLGVADVVEQLDDVRTGADVLEDLEFPFDFLLLHGLEDLDHHLVLRPHVDTLERLAVLAWDLRTISISCTCK